MAAIVRQVEPEWLDQLPADDPRAIRSRRDLRRVNALMDNAGIVARELRRAAPFGLSALAEIGAGDGVFALRIAHALAPAGRGTQVTLLDRQDIVAPVTAAGFARAGWTVHAECGDVFDWLRGIPPGRFDAIVANLFLHHFDGPRLAELLALIAARARCLIACEPRRSRAALAGSRLLGLVGCNDVTRHDAVASVRAGFAGTELSALWPAAGWILEERARGLFSHCFVARRT